MNSTLVILTTLLTLFSPAVKDGSIHDDICIKSDGSIYFMDRYDLKNNSDQQVSKFVDNWYNNHLLDMGFSSNSEFIDAPGGVLLYNISEDIDHSQFKSEVNSNVNIKRCQAYYNLNFIVFKGKLKLTVDNMFLKIEAESRDSQQFVQIISLEDTYNELTSFENLIIEKCRETRNEELQNLVLEVTRLKKKIKKASKSKKKAKRVKDMKIRMSKKNKRIKELEDFEQFESIIKQDVEKKVSYDKIFQVEKWNLISDNFKTYIESYNHFADIP